MEKTKHIRLSTSQAVKLFLPAVNQTLESIQVPDCTVKSSHIKIYGPDYEVSLDYSEAQTGLVSIEHPQHLIASTYFGLEGKVDPTLLTLNIYKHGSDLYSVSVQCNNPSIIDNVFDNLSKNVYKKNFYKHNPRSNESAKRRAAIELIVELLEQFDQIQIRNKLPVNNEKDFQDLLFPVLRSHFDDLIDEHYLPTYGAISYKPDFGSKSNKIIIEAKYLRKSSDLKSIQKEIHDDAIGYLGASRDYKSIVVAVYNANNMPVSNSWIKDLNKAPGVDGVVICPGIQPRGG